MLRLALICIGLVWTASSLGCCCGGCPNRGCGGGCGRGSNSCGCGGSYSAYPAPGGCCGGAESEAPITGFPTFGPTSPVLSPAEPPPVPGPTPPASVSNESVNSAYNGIVWPPQSAQSLPSYEPLPPPRTAIQQQQYYQSQPQQNFQPQSYVNPGCPSCGGR